MDRPKIMGISPERLNEFISISTYATMYNIKPKTIKKALEEKRLDGAIFGTKWIIPRTAKIRERKK